MSAHAATGQDDELFLAERKWNMHVWEMLQAPAGPTGGWEGRRGRAPGGRN